MKDDVKKYITHIDNLLSEGQYDNISAIFTNDFMRQIDCDELAYLSLFVLIYREEVANGVQNTSFSLGTTTEELIQIFRQLKFFLWEFELDNNEETTNNLINFIISYGITAEFLRTVVITSSIDKEKTLKRLSLIIS